ncbi:MAG: hypothetical protein IKR34_07355, partial [Candidatus Gastranaerophilales bacterium]|nr:hypothetical protein [Candidatus Gastranaerophilales bacterium]
SEKGSTTANFMKDLIKSLPAMHDLANQAGIELPQILGKVDVGENAVSSNEAIKIANITDVNGTPTAYCPHCAAKYKLKEENGKMVIPGIADVDPVMSGQQIYCIKCGKKFSLE